MAIGTKLGRLALRTWVRPADDFKPALTIREMPTFNYTEAGLMVLPRNYRAGLVTQTGPADVANDITIAVGQCRDSSDAKNILLETAINKQLDATWAEGTAAGGLNATDWASGSNGVEPDTTYHIYLIKDTGAITAVTDAGGGDVTFAASSHLLTTNSRVTISGTLDYDGDYAVTAISAGVSFNVTASFVSRDAVQTGTYESVDAGFDKSTTAANLLSDSGYTYYRRVGSLVTDSTAAPDADILNYTQRGNHFIPKLSTLTSPAGNSVLSASRTTITLLGCPVGFEVLAKINIVMDDAAGWGVHVSSLDSTDQAVSETAAPLELSRAAAGIKVANTLWVRTNTSAQIGARSRANPMDQADMALLGWIDDLGDYS